jgi:hypothetical protein
LTVVSWHSTTRSMLTFLKIPCTFISAMYSIPRTFFRDYLTSFEDNWTVNNFLCSIAPVLAVFCVIDR